jgi:sterol 14-demethylase
VDGKGNTDDQIVGLLIALLFAGQHTSSITSTWTALFLAHDPALYKRAQKEVAACHPAGETLTYVVLRSSPLSLFCLLVDHMRPQACNTSF